VLAAELLKLTDVPVMIARGWSAAKIRAYRIADNKLALLSGWDDELLGLEFADLRDLGVDLELTGFTVAELDQLWADENDPNREWEGMPEFVQQSRMAFRSIIVHLAGPEDVEKFAKLVKQPVGEKTRWIWYPPQPRAQHENKQFVTGEAAE
jgi:ParB-like chromosome segregation protein Spo0J